MTFSHTCPSFNLIQVKCMLFTLNIEYLDIRDLVELIPEANIYSKQVLNSAMHRVTLYFFYLNIHNCKIKHCSQNKR